MSNHPRRQNVTHLQRFTNHRWTILCLNPSYTILIPMLPYHYDSHRKHNHVTIQSMASPSSYSSPDTSLKRQHIDSLPPTPTSGRLGQSARLDRTQTLSLLPWIQTKSWFQQVHPILYRVQHPPILKTMNLTQLLTHTAPCAVTRGRHPLRTPPDLLRHPFHPLKHKGH